VRAPLSPEAKKLLSDPKTARELFEAIDHARRSDDRTHDLKIDHQKITVKIVGSSSVSEA
jgi:hypothetical protein